MTIHDVQTRSELNGQSGLVLAYDEASERYTVSVDGGGPVRLKAANVRVEIKSSGDI